MIDEEDVFGDEYPDVVEDAEEAMDEIVDGWEDIEDDGGISTARIEQVEFTVEEALLILESLDGRSPQASSVRSKVRDALDEVED